VNHLAEIIISASKMRCGIDGTYVIDINSFIGDGEIITDHKTREGDQITTAYKTSVSNDIHLGS